MRFNSGFKGLKVFGKKNLRHRNDKWHCMEVKIESSGMLCHDDW